MASDKDDMGTDSFATCDASTLRVSSKLPNSAPSAQKVFDEMAPQQMVFMGGFLDSADHNLGTVMSTLHSSKVPQNTTTTNDYMLRGFLRIRNHHINKGSVKRLKHLKWKLVASSAPTTAPKALVAALTFGLTAPTASAPTHVQASPALVALGVE